MIRLEVVTKENEALLYNLMQKYLYEMSITHEKEMDENGNYPYKYLSFYFTEPERVAYFIYEDERRIGFALVNPYSFTEEKMDSCLAEFTIFPAFRKRGYAEEAFEALRKARPGSWQLKYSSDNPAGSAFWRKIGEKYGGRFEKLDDRETILTVR